MLVGRCYLVKSSNCVPELLVTIVIQCNIIYQCDIFDMISVIFCKRCDTFIQGDEFPA
jgi:hypothetical protein